MFVCIAKPFIVRMQTFYGLALVNRTLAQLLGLLSNPGVSPYPYFSHVHLSFLWDHWFPPERSVGGSVALNCPIYIHCLQKIIWVHCNPNWDKVVTKKL